MKTLDEVIDDFEKACDLERRCEGCSGCLGQEYGCPNDGAESVPDALCYLKEYRSEKAMWEKTREDEQARYQEAIDNCNRAENKFTLAWKDLQAKEAAAWHKWPKIPHKEGQYLTFCRYRNGSTAMKIKLWKDSRFTSENEAVQYWRQLPKEPDHAAE